MIFLILLKIKKAVETVCECQRFKFRLGDSACGYAALTMMPDNALVLTIEFKVNYRRPAMTDKLIAVGKVLHSDKTLTICKGYLYDSNEEKLLVKMTAMMITVRNKYLHRLIHIYCLAKHLGGSLVNFLILKSRNR